MGRGKRLKNEELAVIKAYKDTGLSNWEIVKKIKRSPKVVNNYFKIGVNYGAYKGSGGKRKIDNRTKRVIVPRAADQQMTASQIRADLQLPVSWPTLFIRPDILHFEKKIEGQFSKSLFRKLKTF